MKLTLCLTLFFSCAFANAESMSLDEHLARFGNPASNIDVANILIQSKIKQCFSDLQKSQTGMDIVINSFNHKQQEDVDLYLVTGQFLEIDMLAGSFTMEITKFSYRLPFGELATGYSCEVINIEEANSIEENSEHSKIIDNDGEFEVIPLPLLDNDELEIDLY